MSLRTQGPCLCPESVTATGRGQAEGIEMTTQTQDRATPRHMDREQLIKELRKTLELTRDELQMTLEDLSRLQSDYGRMEERLKTLRRRVLTLMEDEVTRAGRQFLGRVKSPADTCADTSEPPQAQS